MIPVLTPQQMSECDRAMIDGAGIPSLVLMERAALAAADCVASFSPKRVLCVCGGGNNGGDGAAVARILQLRGIHADILLAKADGHQSEEMRIQCGIAARCGVRFVKKPAFSRYDVIVDAIFGTGLAREVAEPYRSLIERINRSDAHVVAVDIPSGVDGAAGAVMGCAVRAEKTVAVQTLKRGHILYPGADFAGEVEVCDIGIRIPDSKAYARCLTKEDLSLIPARDPGGNKGTFGKVLVAAGSEGMAGAALFAASAALRTGSGMVKVLTHRSNRVILQETLPEALLSLYETAEETEACVRRELAWADAVVCGPGIGTDGAAEAMTRCILRECASPLVLDADGLNVLAGDTEALRRYRGDLVITPHPGEMSRLTGERVPEILADAPSFAGAFAKKNRLTCVLKNAASSICGADGSVFLNPYGNSGMATAGSGDVLSGILGALLARGSKGSAAAALACMLHGLAGEAASKKLGESAVIASDLVAALPEILGDY